MHTFFIVAGVCGIVYAQERTQEIHDTRTVVTPSFYEGVIHLADLGTTSPMFTIKNSGRYYVADDLSLAPSTTSVSAIQINASNVTLNLNMATLLQRSSNTQAGLLGIDVVQSATNVHIMNGKLNGLTGTGIKVGQSCVAVRLEDILVRGCSKGIYASGSAGNVIKDLRIEKTVVTGTTDSTDTAGLHLQYCNDAQVISSSFNEGATTGAVECSGIWLENCIACSFDHCTASGNSSSGDTAFGVQLGNTGSTATCYSCSFKNCVAMNNKGNTAYGFYVKDGKFNRFELCSSAYQTVNSTGNAYGFFVTRTGVSGNMFARCEAFGNTGGSDAGSVGAGFAVEGTEKCVTIEECSATANDGGTGTGYGIFINGGTKCAIKKNRVMANLGTADGYGIRDIAATSESLFESNFAFGNGNTTGTTVNNYDVTPAPSGIASQFPSKIGHFNSFTNLDGTLNERYNIEIIEQAS